QSYCARPGDEDYDAEIYQVDIEGILYLYKQPRDVELWEIDLYCRADDCSSPEIFKELREQINIQIGTLAALFSETHDPTVPQRRCYDCSCNNQPTCPCDRTTILNANSTYCLIMREDYGQEHWITMGHISPDSTTVHVRDLP
ncbi:unnamed protein product, partial [Rotaria sp. Silwood2]